MTSNSEQALPAATGDTERVNRRPRSLIVSFFGTYARDIGGWISVADLIALMAELGVDAPSVRSAVSRLKRRGLLVPERLGGVAGYRLSDEGRRILAEGDRRIFGHQVARVGDGWVLVVFSVPESERRRRHALRSRLTRLGFGTTAAGVWIAPAHMTDQARRTLRDLGMEGYAELFHATHLDFRDLGEAVAQWWDLPALQTMYQEFLAEHEPVLGAWRRAGPAERGGRPAERAEGTGSAGAGGGRATGPAAATDPRAAAFADHLRTVDAWRRMPFLDPGLPPELLPGPWTGSRASRVFFDLHARLREPGLAHVRSVVSRG